MCVKKMFRLLTQRFAEEFAVKRLYERILMGLAYGLARILFVQGIGPCIKHGGIAVVQGLSSTADASSRTGHDFNGMVFIASVPDVFEKMPGISQAVGYADLQLESVQVHRSPTDAFHTSDSLEID